MTPEESEQWQQAINPLDYLDHYATSWTGLRESTERLLGLGVPNWAAESRKFCMTQGMYAKEIWISEFAFRSEVALVGLQVLYPDSGERHQVHGRVLLRFLQEAFTPFAAWTLDGGRRRRHTFGALVTLVEICGCAEMPDPAEWQKLDDEMPFEVGGIKLAPVQRRETSGCLLTCSLCVMFARKYLFEGKDIQSVPLEYDPAHRIIDVYSDRKPGIQVCQSQGIPNVTEFVANAFLTALESECPAPKWLQSPS
ncbi:MAG: hypothetical protein QM758_01290 [Armatimonas sp.]